MDAVDFTEFCEIAQETNMDVSDIRSRVYRINEKLLHMRLRNRKQSASSSSSSGSAGSTDSVAARAAVFVIRDMTEGLRKFRSPSCVTALAGGAEVLAAILPKMELLGDIGGDFIGVAASVFQHFNVGRPQGVDKVLDACVLESREFATDTELLTPVLELQGELSHQMVFLGSLVPGTLCEEEAPGLCFNLPAGYHWEAMHILEDRIKLYFAPHLWRTDNVNIALTYVRLFGHLLTLRLIVLCRIHDALYRTEGLSNAARAYLGAMKAVLAVAKKVLGFFKTGEFFAITSCVGPMEWPAVYVLLTLIGDDHSQCGDWLFIDQVEGIVDIALSVGKGRLGGEHYYIGRTEFRDELKVGKVYGRKMYWTSEGVEYTTDNIHEYEILCISDRRVHATWRNPTEPASRNAYRAARTAEGGKSYVGRMTYQGGLVVGEVVKGVFSFSYYGKHIVETDHLKYEVLCLASR